MQKRFGKEAADLWKTATEGGKTQLLNQLLENESRNGKLDNKLNNEIDLSGNEESDLKSDAMNQLKKTLPKSEELEPKKQSKISKTSQKAINRKRRNYNNKAIERK